MNNSFLTKYSHVYGKKSALLLKLSGLVSGEVKGERCWVYDESGRRFLDFGSFGVHLLGHCHPRIIQVANSQVEKMGLSTKILGNKESTDCAVNLLSILPSEMNSVLFTNSGSESTELALKAAVVATGKNEFISFTNAYHGKTTGAYNLTYQSVQKEAKCFSKMNVHFFKPETEELDKIDDLMKCGKIAGVFIEPIQGEGGINIIPMEFLEGLHKLCNKYGVIFILDEIQTGLGRCGSVWAAVKESLCPDILLCGKILGGGLVPIAATVFKKGFTILDDPIITASSFSGGAFATSIANEAINIVKEPEFLEDVRKKGEYSLRIIEKHLSSHKSVVDIRACGLMMGIEFKEKSDTALVLNKAMEKGTLTSFCLTKPKVLRIYPPAVTNYDELDLGISQIIEAVQEEL